MRTMQSGPLRQRPGPGCGLRTADCGLRTADCGLRAAGCGLRAAGCGRCHPTERR
ncbi:hypothetical protein GTY38_09045 [Streptomyces sp. SID8369]|nr:hypothetical protein [Streptomyces sp. SID8369]